MTTEQSKLLYNIKQGYYISYALHDVAIAKSEMESVKVNQNMIGTFDGVSNQCLKRKKRAYLKRAHQMVDDYNHTYDDKLDDYSKKPSKFGYYHLVALNTRYQWLIVKYFAHLPVKATIKENGVTLIKSAKQDKNLDPIFKDFTISFLKNSDGLVTDWQPVVNQVYNVLLLAKGKNR